MYEFHAATQKEFNDLIKNEYNEKGIYSPSFMDMVPDPDFIPVKSSLFTKLTDNTYVRKITRMKYCCKENIYPQGFGQEERHFVFCTKGDEVVGVCKFKIGGNKSIRHPSFQNWLDFISVSEEHQGQGIGAKMAEMMYEYLAEKNENHILISGYSEKGLKYIAKKLRSLAEKFSFRYMDEDKVSF